MLSLILASTVAFAAASNLLPPEYRDALQARHFEARQLSNTTGVTSNSTDGYRYLNNGTQPFLVDSLPDVPFSLGEMYAGSLPITRANTTVNGTGDLFFVFKPTSGDPVDELTIWLNGGPGWSSMEGFFQENGPVMWGKGTWGPVANAYSWSNLTNMIWVDQPISTGFAVGTPTATNENDVADQFLAFLANFEDQFNISNYKVYLTGESAAGTYIPYIAAGMLERNNSQYFNLSGALMYDPTINSPSPAATVPFIQENSRLLNYNQTFLSSLEAIHQSCGFPEYLDQYLAYPPNGTQPPPTTNKTCSSLAGIAGVAEIDLNPCFSIYDIREACPTRYDPLGHSTDYTYNPPGVQPYFNRSDVKQALHAPDINWVLDNGGAHTFAGGMDTSDPVIYSVLPKVIEATGRVLIGSGDFDMLINTNATMLSIQNMTWGGQLGFQSKPSDDFEVPLVDLQYNPQWVTGGFLGTPFTEAGDPQGVMGIKHFERGLMWCEVFQGGHSLPATQPRAAYRHLQWVLGRIDDL